MQLSEDDMNAPDQQALYAQQQAQQEELVAILKRVDMGVADHADVVALAAALGLTRYFTH